MTRWLREPLVHFVVLGAALFGLYQMTTDGSAPQAPRIVVTAGQIDALASNFSRVWQRTPTAPELDGLIQAHIREEVLYREALAMGLDRDDTVVRRRLQQKAEFLFEDIAMTAQPTDEELNDYLLKNPEAFRLDPRVSFAHIYLNPERGDGRTLADATELLARVNSQSAATPAHGDPFLLGYEFPLTPRRDIAALFGASFAERIVTIDSDQWTGPIESGYGWHLVRIRERIDGRMPALEDVRDVVAREWQAMRRTAANEQIYAGLRARYEVTVERPDGFQTATVPADDNAS